MDRENASRLASEWSNYATSAWRFGADYNGDNERTVRVAMRRHVEAFVPECDHAEVFVSDDKFPAVVAFDGDALYRVQVTAFEDARQPEFSVERFPLTTGAVTLSSTFDYSHHTAWRVVQWSFPVTDNQTVMLGTSTHVFSAPDPDELLCRAVAAKLGYELPPEPEEEQRPGLSAA